MPNFRVLHWNGKDLPEELRELPAGTYIIECVDETPSLTSDEESGITRSLASLRQGQGRSIMQVRQRIDSVLCKGPSLANAKPICDKDDDR